MPGYTRESGNTLDVVGVCVNRIGMDRNPPSSQSRSVTMVVASIILRLTSKADQQRDTVRLEATIPSSSAFRRLPAVDFLAAAEAAGHPSCLELGAPGRRVGREVACYRQ